MKAKVSTKKREKNKERVENITHSNNLVIYIWLYGLIWVKLN
jgi:hypothetical protein